MTPKQILDSFSETLVWDDRILSAPERALIATLLQHAKAASGENPETQEAVRAVIASAVGEAVAQRAFAVLGGSIVERILETSTLPHGDSAGVGKADIYARPKSHKEPQLPNAPMRTPGSPGSPGEPQPPGHSPGPGVRAPHKEPHQPMRDNPVPPHEPQPPGSPLRTPGEPQPPGKLPMRTPGVPSSPGEPQPPGHGVHTTVVSEARVLVVERPAILPAKCVVLDEFLAPQELDELTRFTMEHEGDFKASEVISPKAEGSADGGIVNYEHRRSRVLMDLGQHQDLVLERIKAVLPQVLHTLGIEEFSITGVEVQVTASNDGDFFHFHSDNGSDRVASRHLTFVYFFHREPRQFEGGELRIHDARLEEGSYVSAGSYQTIIPQQNQIVFFPCELLHEITPVNCVSQLFADSRFTLNGWLRR